MADNTTEIIYVDGEGLKHVVNGLEKKINDKESWKAWSEENESSGDEKDVYIGERNTVANEFPDGSTPPTEDVYRAKAYSFGKDNITTYSQNYNISEAFIKLYTPTAVHIGNNNTIAGEGINVGKQNKVSDFGIALGQRNNAANASLALGSSAKADRGSFAFSTLSYSATADNNSFAVSIGGTATADTGSYLIAACGGTKSNAMGGSIGIGDNLSSQRGSIAIVSGGTNNADSAGVILGHHTLTGTNGGIAIGHSSISAKNGAITLGSQSASADNGAFAIGHSNISARNGAITLGLQGVSADNGAIAIGRTCSADTGALVFGTENISAFTGGIAIGRGSDVSAKTGAISLGLGGNNAEAHSIAIGINRNKAIYASISVGDNNYSEYKAMTLGEQQYANGSSISLGFISTNTEIDLNSELNVLVYTQSYYQYVPHVKFKQCAVVTGTWSGDTFTESSSGKSKAIKTDSGKYYSHYSQIPLSELTVTHIDGIRNASTGALEVYGTPINSRSSDPSYTSNSQSSHPTNWIEITNSERANISIQNLNSLIGRTYYGSTGHSITIGGGSRADNGSVAINAIYKHPFSTYISTTTINGVYVPSEMNVTDYTGYNAYALSNAIAIGHNTYSLCDSIALNANSTATYGSICIGIPVYNSRQAFATNGSIVLGNGSHALNGSVAIGRYNSANCAYAYGNSNNVTYGAIAIGDDNVGNGWSFIGGWKNTASGAGHALIFGHDNYSMVYESNIVDQIHSTPSSKVYNQVFSTIFGTSNKSYGRFHFVHGLYNTVGNQVSSMSEDNERINDGMCIAIGKYNIATRNYDMAIGYKAVADGVVDWLQQYDSVTDKYYPAGGQNFAMHDSTAVGAKNFALINSIVYGISNIGMHDTQVFCQFTDDDTSDTNYEHESYKQLFRNYLVCAKVMLRNNGKLLGFARNNVNDSYLTLETNSENTYSHIDDNIISLANITLNSKENASRNIIRSSTINATGLKIFSDNIIIGNQLSQYSSYGDHLLANVDFFDKNILLGKTNTKVSNTYAMTDNIILGSSSNTTNIESAHTVTTNLFSYNSKVTLTGSIDCTANVLLSDSTLKVNRTDSTYNRSVASYNFLMRSSLFGTSATKPIIPSTGGASINPISNFLVGTIATDCYETVSLASGDLSYGSSGSIALLTNTAQSFNVGNNTISSAFNANVIGHGNILSAVTNSFIFGRSNIIYGSYGSSLTSVYDPVADNIIVFGEQNKVLAPKYVERIRIFGLNNIIDSPNPSLYYTALNDLTIFGNDNKTISGIGHADRDFIFGSNNTLRSNVCDGFVFGTKNTIGASEDDASGIVYSGMMSLGSNNVVQNGSYAFALGGGNVSTGHHSMSFGLQLQTNEFQAVIGKYNKPLTGTKRYSTSEDKNLTPVDITAGAAFVVGNGYADPGTLIGTKPYQSYSSYDWRDEEHIHRSNAMVVWQNGDVEATDFILKYNGKKYRLTDILDAIGVDLSNVEEVINDN